jgi:Lipopolysaccharide-assembly
MFQYLASALLKSISLVFIFSSCGYLPGQGGILDSYQTIFVPFVDGDIDGELTASLVKHFSTQSSFTYSSENSDLILKVKVIDFRDENIGFRYDRNKKGHITHSVIPTETRLTMAAEVVVIESSSGKNVLGPVKIAASVDFDHEYYSSRNGVNIFSLGQLSDIDEARDAVMTPLNRKLARKIVEFLNDSW